MANPHSINRRINPNTVHPSSDVYTHCVVIPTQAQLVMISGQVGIDPKGHLAADFAGQIRQAWRNVIACLQAAGAGIDDLVQTRTYIVTGQDLDVFQKVRREFVAQEPPSSTVLIVPRLLSLDHLFEVEVVAAMP